MAPSLDATAHRVAGSHADAKRATISRFVERDVAVAVVFIRQAGSVDQPFIQILGGFYFPSRPRAASRLRTRSFVRGSSTPPASVWSRRGHRGLVPRRNLLRRQQLDAAPIRAERRRLDGPEPNSVAARPAHSEQRAPHVPSKIVDGVVFLIRNVQTAQQSVGTDPGSLTASDYVHTVGAAAGRLWNRDRAATGEP
jgi:hypothetical protein